MQFTDDDTPMTIDDGTQVPFFPEETTQRSPETKLLLGLGFLLSAAGGVMVAAPHFSWTLTGYGRQLEGQGVSAGMLLAAGFVLFGLGLVARVASRAGRSRAAAPQALQAPRVDLRETTDRLDELSQGLALLESMVTGLTELAAQPQPSELGSREELVEAFSRKQNDALFRLAASLDQLGARLEVHFDRGNGTLAGTLSAMGQALEELRTGLRSSSQEAQEAFAAVAPALEEDPWEGAELGATPQGPAPQPSAPAAQPQAHPPAPVADPQPQASQAAAPAPQQHAPQQPAPQMYVSEEPVPPAPPRGGEPLPEVAAPSQVDPAAALPGEPQAAPPAPAPHRPQPNQVGIEGSADDLDSLLPDYRVREAIDDRRLPPL